MAGVRDIALHDSGPALSDRDVDVAEREIGSPLPGPVRAFYRSRNGGYPDRRFFRDGTYESELNRIIPMSARGAVDPDNMVEIYRMMTSEGHLPVGHLPFGEDSGGNFYLIDPSDGHVWYMPMDEWHHHESAVENWQRSGRFVSPSFEAFLDALTNEAM